MKPQTIAPAPWFLTGNGIVMIYRIPEAFNRQYGCMETYQQDGYKGGLGAVMLMDYRTSDVGPYQELLFIPALFSLGGRLGFSISKIYVSTKDSLWNGVQNWGIPKEQARFSTSRQADGSLTFTVGGEENPFFKVHVKPHGLHFPFWTKLLPLFRIMQQSPDGLLLTKPRAKGKAQLASLKKIRIDPAYFPPLEDLEPLLVCTLSEFEMIFPIARNLNGPTT